MRKGKCMRQREASRARFTYNSPHQYFPSTPLDPNLIPLMTSHREELKVRTIANPGIMLMIVIALFELYYCLLVVPAIVYCNH